MRASRALRTRPASSDARLSTAQLVRPPLCLISGTAVHVTVSANAALSPAATPLVQPRRGSFIRRRPSARAAAAIEIVHGAGPEGTSMTKTTGARYEISVDGQPRSNRDDKTIAIKAAEYLKRLAPKGR